MFGLFQSGSNVIVPLKRINITVDILSSVTKIVQEQEYFDDTQSIMETVFFFPKTLESIFGGVKSNLKTGLLKEPLKKGSKPNLATKSQWKTAKLLLWSKKSPHQSFH